MSIEDKAVFEWEKDTILPDNIRDEMETMWELPQIYHFLQLTKEAFKIKHLSMYEVERMLLMPKASNQLAHIMTCLLGNPLTIKIKFKSQKVPLMPYSFWTKLLLNKLKHWFKVYHWKKENSIKMFECYGIEPEFWTIFFDANDIDGKDFQDFNFKQRVWLLKTICDTTMHSRKMIQDEILKQPSESQFETVLGMDRYGARYVYFPQFLHNDIRVYKHVLDNEILSSVRPPFSVSSLIDDKQKLEKKEEIDEEENMNVVTINENFKSVNRYQSRVFKRKKRRSRWSKGSLPTKIQKKPPRIKINFGQSTTIVDNQSFVDSNSMDASQISKNLDCSDNDSSNAKSSGYDINSSVDVIDNKNDDKSETKEDDKSLSDHSTNDSFLVMDDMSKSSKTDDEKLEEINASKSNGPFKDLKNSKSDDEKLSENNKSDELSNVDDKTNVKDDYKEENKQPVDYDNDSFDSNVNDSYSSRRSARIKQITEIKSEIEDAENIVDMCETEEMSSIDLRDSLCRVSSPEDNFFNNDFNENDWKVENFDKLILDLGVSNFQLVADSLDSLKDLIESISSDKTVPVYSSKEKYASSTCEFNLLKRMRTLETSLENVASILKDSTKKARNKLQQEWSDFENGKTKDEEANNGWLYGLQGYNIEQPYNVEQSTEIHSQSSLSQQDDIEEINDETTTKNSKTNLISSTTTIIEETQSKTPEKKYFESISKEVKIVEEKKKKKKEECEQEKCVNEESNDKEKEEKEEEEEDDDDEQSKAPKRVLRARGVSSYNEQFFSDDSDEDQLDGWADIEAIYAPATTRSPAAAPSLTKEISAINFDQNSVSSDFYDDNEKKDDSDQDWILPSSRKRNRKRSSASRRLKSFQYKMQNIQDNKNPEDNNHQQRIQLNQRVLSHKVIMPHRQRIINQRYNQQSVTVLPTNVPTATVPPLASKMIKTEPQDSKLHSVLDIKDEGPIYDTSSTSQSNLQQNYVVVTTGQPALANYYVMHQNSAPVVPQNQYVQSAAYVSQVQMQNVPAQGYYVQSANPNYIVQSPAGIITTAATQRPTYVTSTTPGVVYQQQQYMQTTPNYVQYVATTPQQQQQKPRIINSTTLTPIRQLLSSSYPRAQMRMPPGLVPVGQRPNFAHPPNGAVIRSAPIRANILFPNQRVNPPLNKRQVPRLPNHPSVVKKKPVTLKAATNQTQKSTSLIVLSDDSNDEIEMIIPPAGSTSKIQHQPKKSNSVAVKKNIIPPELLERMNEGGISLKPIKPATVSSVNTQQQNNSTQLVVVVNETGSHYALALPNGSKIVLTPEQVAQIRASNGGKLVL